MLRALPLLLVIPSLASAESPPAPPVFDAAGRTIGAPLSDRIVAYAIDARLDPTKHELVGTEHLTWTNKSSVPQSVLWFHLYWNAFRNERSTFHRESNGGFRSEFSDLDDDDWGWQRVTRMTASGADVLPSLHWEHPDDDNADDRTVFTVTLPRPVPPGDSVLLDIAWTARAPRVIARAGRLGDFYMLGQWFPKIGVLEVPPTRGAAEPRWNCHQYHASSEFYADFGSYDVRMTVPREMIVGATGVLVDKHDNADGTTTWHHHQDDVHDFAWTAWKGFDVVEDVFRSPGLPEVKITLLANPDHPRSRAQYLEAAKASLEHYGRWWMPWPYPHLTLVDPPDEADEAGGMEYPTFITLGGVAGDPVEPRDYVAWDVVAHEFGHNYWYGIIASNEFEESWLDEGINSYGTGKLLMAEHVPVSAAMAVPRRLRPLLRGMLSSVTIDEDDTMRFLVRAPFWTPIVTAAWRFLDSEDYAINSYTRTEATLDMLERMVGPDVMARIMRTYVERWKFKHPRSEDFFAVVDDVTGKDWSWFWDEFFHGTEDLDYAVGDVDCESAERAHDHGFFDDGKGGLTLRRDDGSDDDDEKGAQRCELIIERKGGAWAPVDVRIEFDDHSTETLHWGGRERWRRFVLVRPHAVASVVVDPDGKLFLDGNLANNSWSRMADRGAAARFVSWLTYVAELVASIGSAG